MPCDVENNCHQNAHCEWVESELRNKCVCKPGFDGDGYACVEREISCLFVCHFNLFMKKKRKIFPMKMRK